MDRIREIPRRQMEHLWQVFRSDATVRMCRRIIRQTLFSNGIEFSQRKARGIRPDPNMQDVMDDYWLPFCEDALDSAMVTGFVVVEIVKQHGCRIPVVRRPGTYSIGFDASKPILEYVVWDITSTADDPIPNTFVFDFFGSKPMQNGTIVSQMTAVLPDILYWQQMSALSLNMESHRAVPPIVTEVQEKSGGRAQDDMEYDFYADGDGTADAEEAKFSRNASQVKQLQRQQELLSSYYRGEPVAQGHHEILERVTPLPIGQKITNVPQNQGRSDLVHLRKSYQDAVCGIMGVPRSMVMSDTPHKADTEGTHRTFQQTILYWRGKLSKLAEDLYNIIYEKSMTKQIVGELEKRKRRCDGDVYELKKRVKVTINFPVTPFTGNSELYNYYQQGVIPWERYVMYVHQNTSMPLDCIPEEPNKKVEEKSLKKEKKGKQQQEKEEEEEEEDNNKEEQEEQDNDEKDVKEDKKDVKDDKKKKADKINKKKQ